MLDCLGRLRVCSKNFIDSMGSPNDSLYKIKKTVIYPLGKLKNKKDLNSKH